MAYFAFDGEGFPSADCFLLVVAATTSRQVSCSVLLISTSAAGFTIVPVQGRAFIFFNIKSNSNQHDLKIGLFQVDVSFTAALFCLIDMAEGLVLEGGWLPLCRLFSGSIKRRFYDGFVKGLVVQDQGTNDLNYWFSGVFSW